MLDGKKVKVSTGGDFEPLPMDKYTTQIIDVSLVTQLKFKSTEEEEVLNYKFVVLDDKPLPTKEGEKPKTTRGRFLWRRCRLAINDRSHLGKLAKAVIGRNLTKEDVESFDPESLVGKQVDVMVVQSEGKDGTVYANISDFAKTVKKLEEVDPEEITKPVQAPVKKTKSVSVPATAPAVDGEEDDPDTFAKSLEEEGETKKTKAKGSDESEESDEESEEELAALEAAAKVAEKKAAIAKKKRLAGKTA